MTSFQQTHRAKSHQYSFAGSFWESPETFANTMWIIQGAVLRQSSRAINLSRSIRVTTSNHVWLCWTTNQQISTLMTMYITLHYTQQYLRVRLHAALVLPWIVSSARASMESFALSARQLYIPPSSSVRLKICRLPPPSSSKRPSLHRGNERGKKLVNTPTETITATGACWVQ